MDPNPQQILNNPDLDAQLLNDGYVIVPFLNSAEVQALTTFFNNEISSNIEGIYASAHVPEVQFRKKVNNFIKAQYSRAIAEYFYECSPLGGSYIIKGPGEKGTLYPHQDWNIVDESQFRSFNIWIPLIDVNGENGAITVLEESHKKFNFYRGVNIPCAFHQIYDELWSQMKLLNMKAGEALIYDHRLVHGSKSNNTTKLRLAAVYGIVPQAASMRYYYRNEASIEEYACDPSFYATKNSFDGPQGLQLIKSIPYKFPTLNESDLKMAYGKMDKNQSILKTIKSWFK